MRIDGMLAEAVYSAVEPASDFIQMEPRGGDTATERTEVWITYDDENVYVSFRVWESQPDRMIVNEMRRDSANIRQGDAVGFALDTFRDRRNALQFEANALGARTDGQSTNERQYSADWNPVWDVAAGRFSAGWTVEAAIPFKSIRYAPGVAQDWGFQARRVSKWKNEISFLTQVPPAFGMGRGDFSASLYANVVGLEAPPPSRTLDLKPFAIADVTTDFIGAERRSNEPGADVGGDAKYALAPNITADLTVNTDFAQVEADEQQINLTRFSLFFPEKRDFFLENQGLFTFGTTTSTAMQPTSDVPILFYSRRIGLAGNQEVPILAGGRVTGRVGAYQIGALNMQTRRDEDANTPATNFTTLRLKRDVFSRSSIGAVFTSRSDRQIGPGSNQAYGVDGIFSLSTNLTVTSYWAKTDSEGLDGDDTSYRGQLEYLGDRYGLTLERLAVDTNFDPEMGFVRRPDMRKSYALGRFSPRPASLPAVRKFVWTGQLTYIENNEGWLSTRLADGEFAIEFQNSDRFSLGIVNDYERVERPFLISDAVIPVGEYDFTSGRIGYTLGQQHRLSGNILYEQGSFYDGTRTGITLSRSRLNVSPQLSLEPNVTLNWIDLPAGDSFITKLLGSRITYTMTPHLFVSALVQYNSTTASISTNARLRWEYGPGSELFIVYNEEQVTRDAVAHGGLLNRSIVIKVNRLFRF